jgi:hypothetical protein
VSEPTGTFGGIWISDDRTEIAVEMIDRDGDATVAIVQVWADVIGFHRPIATDICVNPETLDKGWTYHPPS